MKKGMRSKKGFIRSQVWLAVASVCSGVQLAHAGAGWGDSTNSTGAPIKVPTYYANSPSGLRVDPINPVLDPATGQPVPSIDTGKPLRKFVDTLPPLGCTTANNLGQCIPVAVPDTTTYPGSDYYEIGIVEYAEQMHSDLVNADGTRHKTRLRGYVQLKKGTHTPMGTPHYLGPLIIAQSGRPVRVKYVNLLPVGSAGNLFLPVDTTLMGGGLGPDGVDSYTENRALFHLHGGDNPWISDGTPWQWTVPVGDGAVYQKGDSFQNVPDMPDPGQGSGTLYWPNGLSGRLMFYHDHSAAITRLNVYAGEAAGYLIVDPAERGLMSSGVLPSDEIPLIIQDKTFVPKDVALQDAKWDTTHWGQPGDLWFPHVYETNQDPNSFDGTNPVGRWDWGPWFWPVFPSAYPLPNGNYGDCTPDAATGAPNCPSTTPEAFHDTPVVNGTAYPTLTVDPKAYRFRILNAANDRFFNLGLYVADPTVVTDDGRTNTEVKMVPAVPTAGWPAYWPTDSRDGGVPDPATAGPDIIQIGNDGGLLPTPVDIPSTPINYEYNRRSVTVLNVSTHGLYMGPAERADVVVDFSQYAGKTLILYNDSPAPVPGFDPRIDYYTGDLDYTGSGGAPGTLPGYGPNTRTIMQIVVRGTAGQNGTPYDLTALQNALPGAYAATQPKPVVPESAFNSAFGTAYTDTYAKIYTGSATQPTLDFIAPEDINYTTIAATDTLTGPLTYTLPGTTTPVTLAAGATASVPAATKVTVTAGNTVQMPVQSKAIQELFEPMYGRMNATLGTELPFTSALIQTTIPLGYIDPATENIADGETQIWKITHNGVDTHAIHFHLVNVQLINRVGWDGTVKPPAPEEVAWKDTVKMNPLEDAIVAVRAKMPQIPFGVPRSQRMMDPSGPAGSTLGFTQVDPYTGNPQTVSNTLSDFDWEYVWHCHILGHEENDMMRAVVFHVPTTLPAAPGSLVNNNGVLTWTDPTPGTMSDPSNEIGFRIERSTNGTSFSTVGKALANATTWTDGAIPANSNLWYRVFAYNASGDSPASNVASVYLPAPAMSNLAVRSATSSSVTLGWSAPTGPVTGFAIQRCLAATCSNFTAAASATGFTDSGLTPNTGYSYTVNAVNGPNAGAASTVNATTLPSATLQAPTNLAAAQITGPAVRLTFNDNSTTETGFVLERSVNGGAFATLANLPAHTGTGAVTYTDSTVAGGTAYAYRVKAVNGPNSSAYSNTANVTVTAATVPAAPSGLTGTAVAVGTTATVTLRWTDNANNETGFTVQWATDPAFATASSVNLAANSTARQVTGLQRGTPYYFRVQAFNGTGASAWSNVVNLTTP